jgi:UDP-N-acetylmuramoyl-tripeptide--D-alanyl-D-alanine ligase
VAAADDVAGKFDPGASGGNALAISWRGQTINVRLQVPGEHNQLNALAAAAGACALGIPLQAVQAGLERFSGVEGRLTTLDGHNSATVIDDTYNANPDSVKAAIRVLAASKPPRYLVLGDMGELGENAGQMHREMGTYALGAGIEKLYALGDLGRETAAAFGAGAAHFSTADELVSSLRPLLGPHATVLVKGSRFMKMERVVAKLVPNYGGGRH